MAKNTRSYEAQCLEALAVARAYIRLKAPYYSTIIYGLVPRFIEGIGTLGVTPGMVLMIDPKWYVEMESEIKHIQGIPKEEAVLKMRAGVLVHEANHILRGMSRLTALAQSGIDKGVINLGFDLPINDDLIETDWYLPAWAKYSKTYGFPKGLTGEQYVELLLKMQQEQLQKFKQLTGNTKPQVGSGRCGGCGGNDLGDIEKEIDKEEGRTPADQQRIRKEAVGQLRDAAANRRGSVPYSLQELFEGHNKKSVVPWKSRLRNVLRRVSGQIQSGQADYSMSRPSKRSYSRGIIRPGLISRKPEVAIFEDSSGSMGLIQLQHARAEMQGVFTQLGIPVAWFTDIDADISSKPRRIRLRDLATLPVHGRGGTDFRPAFEAAEKFRPKPDILIYMTDGDGIAPAHPPKGMVTVWCIVPTPHGRRPAKWGELVVVSNDQDLLEPYEHPEEK